MTDVYLLRLRDVCDEAYARAVDADWHGDPNAHILWKRYEDLKKRLDMGELYEPSF